MIVMRHPLLHLGDLRKGDLLMLIPQKNVLRRPSKRPLSGLLGAVPQNLLKLRKRRARDMLRGIKLLKRQVLSHLNHPLRSDNPSRSLLNAS